MTTHDLYDDPELYDAQYRHYRDDLPFYRSLAVDHSGTVLEVGAGTGRVTGELARLAEHVVALEPSAPMRAAAARRLKQAGLAEAVTLRGDDVRDLGGEPRFALIVAPFHVLMHLGGVGEQDAVLAAIRRLLSPGGAFAADVAAPRFGSFDVLRREAEWRDAMGRDAELFLTQHHHPAEQLVESLYLLDRTDRDGRLLRSRARMVQRYYHRYELERAVRGAGFATVRMFGDFDRRPVTDDAARYVVLATA